MRIAGSAYPIGELLQEDRPRVEEARGQRRQEQLFRVGPASRAAEDRRARERRSRRPRAAAAFPAPVPSPDHAALISKRWIFRGFCHGRDDAIVVRRGIVECSGAGFLPRPRACAWPAPARRRRNKRRRRGASPPIRPRSSRGASGTRSGHPVAGIGVRGIPRGQGRPVVARRRDGLRRPLPPDAGRVRRPTRSSCSGTATGVITPDPRDPSRESLARRARRRRRRAWSSSSSPPSGGSAAVARAGARRRPARESRSIIPRDENRASPRALRHQRQGNRRVGGLPPLGRGPRCRRAVVEVVRRRRPLRDLRRGPGLRRREPVALDEHRERFSLALWFAKPLALVPRRWKDRGVRLACQAYVKGPVEVVGVLGAGGKEAREAAGIQ